MGDFNYSDIKWIDYGGIVKGSGRSSSLEFLESINSNSLSQLVDKPTFGNNILDLVITDNPDRIYQVEVGPPIGCSTKNVLHNCLTWSFIVNSLKLVEKTNKKIMLYKKANYDLLNSKFNEIDWKELLADDNIENCYSKFLSIYDQLISDHVPTLIIKNGLVNDKIIKPQWFNNEIKEACKFKFKLFKKLQAAPKSSKPTK